MAQIRYTTHGAAVGKARTIAGKNLERDAIVVSASQYPSIAATEPTIVVIEVGPRKWITLKSDGAGTWTEQ